MTVEHLKHAEKFIELGPWGLVALLFIGGMTLVLVASAAHFAIYFKKQFRSSNGSGSKNIHLVARIENLEEGQKELFKKLDVLIASVHNLSLNVSKINLKEG